MKFRFAIVLMDYVRLRSGGVEDESFSVRFGVLFGIAESQNRTGIVVEGQSWQQICVGQMVVQSLILSRHAFTRSAGDKSRCQCFQIDQHGIVVGYGGAGAGNGVVLDLSQCCFA